jgi:hypothetical protein
MTLIDTLRCKVWRLLRATAPAVVVASALLTVGSALAANPNDRPESAIAFFGRATGTVDAAPMMLRAGRFAFFKFEAPGSPETIRITGSVTPGVAIAAARSGFTVWGPTGGRLVAEGAMTYSSPSHLAEFVATERGTYLLQVYNYNVTPIQFELVATGLPAQPDAPAATPDTPVVLVATPTAVPAATPVAGIDNDQPGRALTLTGPAAGTVPGDAGGSFRFFQFDYPIPNQSISIVLDLSPGDAGTARSVGFVVYGPAAGREYARGGLQERGPTYATTLSSDERGTYLVQVYNYGRQTIAYRLEVTR